MIKILKTNAENETKVHKISIETKKKQQDINDILKFTLNLDPMMVAKW
jgi:hypothetical protein